MFLAIQHENGRRSEALLLAAGKDRMRLAPRGGADTLELNRMGERWYDERGRWVTIGAVVAIEGVGCSQFCEQVHPLMMMTAGGNRVMTAGGN